MNYLLIKNLSGMCLIVFLLSGCNPAPKADAIETPEQLTQEEVFFTADPTVRSGLSSTPLTFVTLSPTLTPLPVDLSALVEKHRCSITQDHISPSGEWVFYNTCMAEYTYPETEYSESTTVYMYADLLYNLVTGKYWIYPPCPFIQGPAFGCNPQAYLNPIAWSPDNKYLYAVTISGGDSIYWFGYMMDLIRINLETGVANIYMDLWAEYSLSPDTSLLTYIPVTYENPLEVYVRDLKESSDFKLILEPDYIEAGDINWSPEGTQFIFLAVNGKYPVGESISLMLVDITNRSRSVLIKDFPHYLDFNEWRTDGILAFHDSYNDHTILYDIENRQLIATPTP